jgi:6-phosphogluconolactonase (cycloisomerase 2 family)
MRPRLAILVLLAFLLLPLATAGATSPPGTLAQLAGAGGCSSQQATIGCTPGRGLDDARAAALSPDGKSLYAVGSTPASLTAFGVDAHNGLLSQLNLSAGCLVSIDQTGCGTARSLNGAAGVVVSPDGLHVYVAAAAAGAVASFARQPNGSLVQLTGIAGCTTTTLTPGCDSAPALAGADAIAISPDGRFVYVAGASADSIVIFSRDAATGRLQVLPGAAGCMRAARTGCRPVTGVDSPSAIAIAPDGTSLYVTSSAGTLTAFQRDVAGGTLTQQPLGSGCFSDNALGDCVTLGGLARASSVVVSASGTSVLVASTDDDAVLSFKRDPASGVLTRVSCVSGNPAATAGCTPSALVVGPRGVALRPDGLVAWVAASRGDSIVTLQLDPASGTLTPTTGTGGCLRRQASVDCRAARALDDPRAFAVSSDGLHVYAVGNQSDGIAVLGPQLPPNCLKVRSTTVANVARSIVLACSDPNGDPITLTVVGKPKHGSLGGLSKSTNAVPYRPAPGYVGADSFTYTATDGLDVSLPGVASVNVKLPPKAPLVRIRTARTHLLQGSRIHVLVECPATAIGACRIATHLVVSGRTAGYGFARLARRTTGRVVVRADGVTGRRKVQVVDTVRAASRRATVVKRTILVLP